MKSTLLDLITDRDRQNERGYRCCSRCYRKYGVELQRPYSGGFLSGICRRCWMSDLDRKNDSDSATPGGLSCPVQFENTYGSDVAIQTVSNRLAKYIGCRSDARWYKKFGSSGDQ